MALCKSAEDLDKVCKVIKLKHYDKFPSVGADTRTIEYKGKIICVVCISSTKGHTKHEINGVLCHEAVHVWQAHCDDIGETKPGKEQEAYAIQRISQNLMSEFWDK